jgi:hypothetical protein
MLDRRTETVIAIVRPGERLRSFNPRRSIRQLLSQWTAPRHATGTAPSVADDQERADCRVGWARIRSTDTVKPLP